MQNFTTINAIGLMSDTDLEGIHAAIITTNGIEILELGKSLSRPYDEYLRQQIKELMGKDYGDFPKKLKKAEYDLTMAHAAAVRDLMEYAQLRRTGEIKVIGFHGHTLYHNPEEGISFQLGDRDLLAGETNIPVINHFAGSDIMNGGQGEPLLATYLATLYAKEERPLAIIHLGGVSTVILIDGNEHITAFNAGPCMACLNEFMDKTLHVDMDYDGEMASKGTANQGLIDFFLQDSYFSRKPPRSAENAYFRRFIPFLIGLKKEDAVATLTSFIVQALLKSLMLFSHGLKEIIVSGGGLKNPYLMRTLKTKLDIPIISSQDLGIDPSMLVAQGYAYIATRTLFKVPSSYPEVTGVREASILGSISYPDSSLSCS